MNICAAKDDCTVFTVCCDIYQTCSKENIEKCIAKENRECAVIDCIGACPEYPNLKEHQAALQCVNNQCQIHPKIYEGRMCYSHLTSGSSAANAGTGQPQAAADL